MTDEALAAAWAAVHANTPEGWYVGRPGYVDRYRQWNMYAFDPSERPVVGKRSREWTAVGQSELHVRGGDGPTTGGDQGRALAEVGTQPEKERPAPPGTGLGCRSVLLARHP